MNENLKTHYNYQEITQWLENKGKERYGNHFKIHETDYPIVYKLIAYFLRDEATCFQYSINLNKDLILRGGLPVAVRYKNYYL
jgi:hypothetical protein